MFYIRLAAITALVLVSSSLLAAEDSASLKSGLQFIRNDTNKTVTIALGNFSPTSYTLAPGQVTTAYVSSDRQNIIIRDVK